MIICFDCSKEGKGALDLLVQNGKFKDAGEAISMALVNYEVIHRAMADGSGVITAGSLMAPGTDRSAASPEPRSTGNSSPSTEPAIRMPTIFGLKATTIDGMDLPAVDEVVAAADITPKDWLWGQFNRFLPAKATCRALFNILRDQPAGLPVDETANKISYEACVLGDSLAASDRLYRRQREVALSAAFPNTGINGGESRSRFQSQFVAALKQGKLTGFPAELHFVTVDGSKNAALKLTGAGATFALLPNPILDGEKPSAGRKWTDAETRFLLDHIRRTVPVETHAYLSIMDGIEAGRNTPDELDAYLRDRFALHGANEIKATFLSTQRTGAVSRMADLDLLYREKSGLRVTYSLSHLGKLFASQLR